MLGTRAYVKVNATAEDDTKCTYAVSGSAMESKPSGACFGIGYFEVDVDFDDELAPCMWPVYNGSKASIGIVGMGVSWLSAAYVRAEVGSLEVDSGPLDVGGLEIYFAGGGWSVRLRDVRHVGPTLPSE